jgi:outer membrane protein assembly factor BamB
MIKCLPFIIRIFLMMVVLPLAAKPGQPLVGTWKGMLAVRGETQPVYLEVKATEADPEVSVTLPIANMFGYDMGAVALEDGRMRAGLFVGTLQKGKFEALFEYYEKSIPIVFERTDEFPSPKPEETVLPEPDVIWDFQAQGAIRSRAVYCEANATLLFGTDAGKLYCLHSDSGKVQWRVDIGEGIDADPTMINAHTLAIYTNSGTLMFVDPSNGNILWRFETDGQQGDADGWDRYAPSPVLVDEKTLLFAGFDGYLRLMDLESKTILWQVETGSAVWGTPATKDNLAILATQEGLVKAFDLNKGQLLWEQPIHADTPCSPLIYNNAIYIGSRNADIWALSLQTGEVLWKRYLWTSWVESSLVVFDDKLYVGSSDIGEVYCLNPADGRLDWKTYVHGSPWSTPCVSGNRLYIGVVGATHYGFPHKGALMCLEKETGKPVWKLSYPEPQNAEGYTTFGVSASPIIASDRLIVGDLSGRLMALKL